MKRNYVFPDAGEEIANLIEKNQSSGKYKSVDDPKEFARVLTVDLRSVNNDRHLMVWVVPEKTANDTSGAGMDFSLSHGKHSNYGFEEVRILPGNIGLIKMKNFSMDEMYDEATIAATNAMTFVSNSDALIFDLRDNPGGGVRLTRYLSSYLYGKTPVHLNDFYFRTSDRTLEYWTLPDIPGKRMPEIPVYILINKQTFSAGEGFAYDLKHLDRATIVGESSGGGSHGGSSHMLDDRFETYIPYSRSVHPVTKTDYEGVGVIPDIKVESDKALVAAQISAIEAFAKNSSKDEKSKLYAKILQDLKAK